MNVTAGELCGGFWDGAYASPVADAYARACALLGENATTLGAPSPWRVTPARSDSTVTADPALRPAYGHAGPAERPVWVAPTLAGAGLLAEGVDYRHADAVLYFRADPLAAAPTALDWATDPPASVAQLWYAEAAPAAAVTPAPDGSYAALVAALAAACDSPATGHEVETVEAVWTAPDGSHRVVTDIAGYRLAAADTPTVAIGDELLPYTPLGGAWTLTRLGRGSYPAELTTPASFHQGVTAGNVTWYDAETPLTVDTASGLTRVRFALGASAPDVAAFWAESHARAVAGARSLAHALDARGPTAAGEPGPESLPVMLNPLRFLCDELLGGNAYLVLLTPAAFGPAAQSTAARSAALAKAAGVAALFVWDAPMPTLPLTGP